MWSRFYGLYLDIRITLIKITVVISAAGVDEERG